MPVTCTEEGRHLIASLSGELDHHAAKSILRIIQYEIDTIMPTTITLDCHELTFTDSSGIAVLLRVLRQAQQIHATMQVTHIPPQADKVFRAAGLHHIIPLEN